MLLRLSLRLFIFPVWLFVVSMLGNVLFPDVASARHYMKVDEEGDPNDGLEDIGGSGGLGSDENNFNSIVGDSTSDVGLDGDSEYIFIPRVMGQSIIFRLVRIPSSTETIGGRN